MEELSATNAHASVAVGSRTGHRVNIRRGFARLATVTAITYGIVSVVIVGAVLKDQWGEREAELHPHEFTVSAPNGRVFVVPARYDWEAISAAKDYDAAHPAVAPAEQPSSNVREWTDEQLMASLNGEYTVRTATRASPGIPFDQFDQPQKKAQTLIRVPVAKYDHPEVSRPWLNKGRSPPCGARLFTPSFGRCSVVSGGSLSVSWRTDARERDASLPLAVRDGRFSGRARWAA